MERRVIDLDGPVSYADFGGRGRPIVLVHGLGGSHVNWMAVGPALTALGHVVAPDLAGFGHTPRAGRSASVAGNRRLLDRFVREVGGHRPAVLVGNSMGGLISLWQAAAAPELTDALVLVGPAAPPAPGDGLGLEVALRIGLAAVPGLGERFVRRQLQLPVDQYLTDLLALICYRPESIAPEVREAHRSMAVWRRDAPEVPEAFAEAARSVIRALAGGLGYRARARRIRAPTLILHGRHDRLVPLSAVRRLTRLRPDWRLHVLEDAGHVPQLEAPEAFVAALRDFLGADRPVARTA